MERLLIDATERLAFTQTGEREGQHIALLAELFMLLLARLVGPSHGSPSSRAFVLGPSSPSGITGLITDRDTSTFTVAHQEACHSVCRMPDVLASKYVLGNRVGRLRMCTLQENRHAYVVGACCVAIA